MLARESVYMGFLHHGRTGWLRIIARVVSSAKKLTILYVKFSDIFFAFYIGNPGARMFSR